MMAGSRTSARQIATRCFCPPDRRPPRGPTAVCRPSPFRKSIFAMCMHCWSQSSVTLVFPYTMFSLTVVSNRMGSWPTKPICERHHLISTVSRGTRPDVMYTLPLAGS
mmetsp:Transcript_56137/g.122976  ORF Transcript_56137/g.122976 Transcript_56137/m.122976 type:complete len:108 (-) Transcript_56137:2218-2541(-)